MPRTASYNFIWQRNGQTSMFPVGLATSVSGLYDSDTLVCENCKTIPEKKGQKIVKQQYQCSECAKLYSSIGFVKLRYNRKGNVVYNTDEKKQFLETLLDREIEVRQEVPLEQILLNHAEILNGFNPLEIFSNDNEKCKATIRQVWTFLSEKKVGLLVEAKYRGDNFLGYVLATTTGKLILTKLKDDKLIKNPYNTSKLPNTYQALEFVSVKQEKEQQFIQAKAQGIELEIPKPKEEVVQPIIAENFFA